MANRINKQIVKDYKHLQTKIPDILEAYGIEKKYLIDNLDMSKQTFFTKLKNQTFSISEMEKICDLLNK